MYSDGIIISTSIQQKVFLDYFILKRIKFFATCDNFGTSK